MDEFIKITENKSLTDIQYRYKQLIQHLPTAIYTCDAHGYICEYNQAAAELWGREPVAGVDMWSGALQLFNLDGSVLPLDECPMAISIKEQRSVKGAEMIIERPDGTRRRIAPHPSPIFDKSDTLTGAVNMLIDITDDTLSEQQAGHMASIVRYSDDAIISKTLKGIVTSWNAAAERMFGYEASEIIGESITMLIPPDRLDEEPKILERLKQGERVDHFETKRMTKDGRLLDISLTISPLKDKHGRIIGASKIARNITGQKEAQRLLNESSERLKMAVVSTGLGTWEYAPQTDELQWSAECRDIYDIPDNLEISFDLFSRLVFPEDTVAVQAAIKHAMDPEGRGDYDIEFRITRYADQKLRWVRSKGKVFFDSKRQPERFIGTVLDVTEEIAAKEALEQTVAVRTSELKKANEDLAASNRDLEQFAYAASHDLQEPLRKIQTFAEILKIKGQDAMGEEMQLYIEKISNSSKKMSALIKDVLGYARISKSEMQFAPVDLNDILHSVIDDLDIPISQQQAIITADELPVIQALQSQIEQLFCNLVTNSLKFKAASRKCIITIKSRMLEQSEVVALRLDTNLRYYQIIYTDNGIGFHNQYSERIFSLFQRLNAREAYPGTGIGLSLCKKVVDNHKGTIAAYGEENVGATFVITLPENQQ